MNRLSKEEISKLSVMLDSAYAGLCNALMDVEQDDALYAALVRIKTKQLAIVAEAFVQSRDEAAEARRRARSARRRFWLRG